jgi:cryptochrome
VRNAKVSANRWRFLLECLRDLDNSLKKFGTRLYIVQGHPIDVFPRLIKEWDITRLTFEYDSEPYPSQRDLAVRRLAEHAGVEVLVKTSHSLFDISK